MDRCNMLLSADRRPLRRRVRPAAASAFGGAVRPPSAGRPGGSGAASAWAVWAAAAAVISVNFACNSCLIADRTIAIRRRFAAVMRTKSGQLGRVHELRPALAVSIPSSRQSVGSVREKALVSADMAASATDFPAVPSTTP